jgi:DNA primase
MEKHNIVAIIEYYGGNVGAERTGWYKTKCPFHEDTHASATINIEYQAFNCFGCGVKGDSYKIIMEQEGVDYREAYTLAERIVGESGHALPTVNTSSRRVSSKQGAISSRRKYSPPGAGRRTTARA